MATQSRAVSLSSANSDTNTEAAIQSLKPSQFSLIEIASDHIAIDVAVVLEPAAVSSSGSYVWGVEDEVLCPQPDGQDGPFSLLSVDCQDNRLIHHFV